MEDLSRFHLYQSYLLQITCRGETIQGFAYESNTKNGSRGVNVVLKREKPIRDAVPTDEKGFYEFDGLTPGVLPIGVFKSCTYDDLVVHRQMCRSGKTA